MRSMKRVPLAVLFLIAAALLTGTPALAAGGLKLVPTGVEPGASGQVWWSKAHIVGVSEYGITYLASVSVTCRGLTPRETYYVYLGGWGPVGEPFIASKTGTGSARYTISYLNVAPKTDVRNANGVVVLTE